MDHRFRLNNTRFWKFGFWNLVLTRRVGDALNRHGWKAVRLASIKLESPVDAGSAPDPTQFLTIDDVRMMDPEALLAEVHRTRFGTEPDESLLRALKETHVTGRTVMKILRIAVSQKHRLSVRSAGRRLYARSAPISGTVLNHRVTGLVRAVCSMQCVSPCMTPRRVWRGLAGLRKFRAKSQVIQSTSAAWRSGRVR